MVLSFSKAADAMMFSVGWQAVEMTTSEKTRDTGKRFLTCADVILNLNTKQTLSNVKTDDHENKPVS